MARESEADVASCMHREIGCWPWDVCAGSIIAQEAGGLVTGANGTPVDNIVDEELLVSRKYFVIRAIADTPVRHL